MKSILIGGVMAFAAVVSQAEVKIPRNAAEDADHVMSQKFWDNWNDDVQKKIDADIEANRKADAVVKVGDVAKGSKVLVEQLSHDFIFGAHIFNFDQLGDPAIDNKYKALYGTFFNSATVSFYWSHFEMQPDRPRFKGEYWDSPEFWRACENPKDQIHWRRPPTDPVIDYLKAKGVRVHGHPLFWGSRPWNIPSWLFDECLQGDEKAKFESIIKSRQVFGVKSKAETYNDAYKALTAKQIDDMFPNFAENLKGRIFKHVTEIAGYYGGKVDSWDVVNESIADFALGDMNVGGKLAKSKRYGLMPADYTYEVFNLAKGLFPAKTKLNINDSPYAHIESYRPQVEDLIARGCKVDIMGLQMHIFNPKNTLDIAAGTPPPPDNSYQAQNMKKAIPKYIWETYSGIDAGIPIHMSEITITAPDATPQGRMMQAIIARNLYRIWFAQKQVMGITWWNVVDDCGAKGEPSMSGLFTRSMSPKPAFYALDGLINGEWKTCLELSPNSDGDVKFRGFRGRYRVSWTDASGNERSKFVYVK